MRVLLTNDDGYDAIGMHTLAKSVRQLGWRATIVAPKHHMSGASRGRISDILLPWQKVKSICGFATYYVDGTPASCVVFGLTSGLFNDFDLCLSGINAGVNLGAGLTISGTFGAVLEATSYKVRGIAFSRENDTENALTETWDWLSTQNAATRILDFLLKHKNGWQLANVNIPNNVVPQTPLAFTKISTESFFFDQYDVKNTRIHSEVGFDNKKIAVNDDIFALTQKRIIGISLLQGKIN